MSELFGRIRLRDEGAYTELYSVVRRTVSASLRTEFGQDSEDVGHEVFMDAMSAIKADVIQKPEAFIPYLRKIIHRRRIALITEKIHARKALEIENTIPCSAQRADTIVEVSERWEDVQASLRRLDPIKQEILKRFYLEGQSGDQIIAEMGLTQTQFRLHKSRGLRMLAQRVEMRMAPTLAKAG
ncbi:MAG: sigma-70 family RNA polymerase sigma factor [Bryobacterales bacterium]|nr:sigma-70 family RNA polymerase sigma factor [Bryobacterales bacterium]